MIRSDSSRFRARLAAARSAYRVALPLRLRQAGDAVLADAKGRAGFPYDTGSLQNSGAVSEPTFEGEHATVTVSFGGDSGGSPNDPVTYAIPVHEGYDLVAWGHPTDRHIAGRPYLEAPLEEDGPARVQDAATAVVQDVADAWRRA